MGWPLRLLLSHLAGAGPTLEKFPPDHGKTMLAHDTVAMSLFDKRDFCAILEPFCN